MSNYYLLETTTKDWASLLYKAVAKTASQLISIANYSFLIDYYNEISYTSFRRG